MNYYIVINPFSSSCGLSQRRLLSIFLIIISITSQTICKVRVFFIYQLLIEIESLLCNGSITVSTCIIKRIKPSFSVISAAAITNEFYPIIFR